LRTVMVGIVKSFASTMLANRWTPKQAVAGDGPLAHDDPRLKRRVRRQETKDNRAAVLPVHIRDDVDLLRRRRGAVSRLRFVRA
jgi:hypothetical protein